MKLRFSLLAVFGATWLVASVMAVFQGGRFNHVAMLHSTATAPFAVLFAVRAARGR